MNRTDRDTPGPADRGGRFFGLFRDEQIEGFEKSFKMAERSLLANRCLIGVPGARISPHKLISVCEEIEMPARFLADFKGRLPGADTIHFGFEENESGFIYKVYLEFARRLYRALEENSAEPVLLHLAYKWDALDRSRSAIARYACYPGLTPAAALQRLAGIYSERSESAALDVVQRIIALASSRTVKQLMYLEVSEAGNPRRSFDINLHEAGIRMNEIQHLLARVQTHYSIPAGEFARLYAQVGREKLAHVSGGLSRDGRDFLTVYHEVGGR